MNSIDTFYFITVIKQMLVSIVMDDVPKDHGRLYKCEWGLKVNNARKIQEEVYGSQDTKKLGVENLCLY